MTMIKHPMESLSCQVGRSFTPMHPGWHRPCIGTADESVMCRNETGLIWFMICAAHAHQLLMIGMFE